MNTTKNYKPFRNQITLAALLALGSLSLSAAHAQTISVTVDGDVVPFVGQPPIEQAGSVLVPLRGVFEKLGASVGYDAGSKTILAVKGQTAISLKLGDMSAQVNGNTRTLSSPARAINGTTLVPLRFVSEALGAQVRWSGPSRTVIITTNGSAPAGANPDPIASGKVQATSLTHNAGKTLNAGDVLTVTLEGTSGGAATFTIPGIEDAESIAMTETSPGVYVGKFTLPAGVNVKGATVLARLKKNGQVSPTLQAGQPLVVDTAGPTLGNLSPAPGSSLAPGKPLIYGTFSDVGTGVSEGSTKLVVNGQDVTADATITESFFSYKPTTNLPAGKSTVTIITHDAAGNQARKDWSFNIVTAESVIKSVAFTPDTGTLEPGDVLTVTMTAKPGGTAHFNIGGALKKLAMREVSDGVYKGAYTVKKGDSLAEAPISVVFTIDGRTVTEVANKSVTIAAGAPNKPTILSPLENAKVGNTLSINGKAAPNTTVRYRVQYQGTLVIVPVTGTVSEGEAKVNERGEWSVADLPLNAITGLSKVTYTISAETIGAGGEVSEASAVAFKRS